jgi:transcriptional regulator with XRE-family HTH domain
MAAPPGVPLSLDLIIPKTDTEGREVFLDQAAVLYAGSIIRRMREHANLTQKQMAERIGTSQPHISDIERGAGFQGPTYVMLVRAARACKLTLTLTVHGASNDPELAPSAATLDFLG